MPLRNWYPSKPSRRREHTASYRHTFSSMGNRGSVVSWSWSVLCLDQATVLAQRVLNSVPRKIVLVNQLVMSFCLYVNAEHASLTFNITFINYLPTRRPGMSAACLHSLLMSYTMARRDFSLASRPSSFTMNFFMSP